MKFDEVLRRLSSVRASGSEYIARCPAHDDKNPSLSVREGTHGQALLFCFAGCSYDGIIAALGGSRNLLPDTAVASFTPHVSGGESYEPSRAAIKLWHAAHPAAGTAAETYLRKRGITMPIPKVIRFASLRHPIGVELAAMVAAVENVAGQVVAIHRTFLKAEGSGKAELEPKRMALGPIRGGAVRLASATKAVVVAEGIETALSVLQATGRPTWAALGAQQLAAIEIPPGIEEVIIAADADDPGEHAARQAAQEFLRKGLRVKIAMPSEHGLDFNDLLRR
jgi:putative DNA primase/helicase